MTKNMWVILIVFFIGLIPLEKAKAVEIIGPDDPRYEEEMAWFYDDWFTQIDKVHANNRKKLSINEDRDGHLVGDWTYQGRPSFLLSSISWRIGINLLTPYIKTTYKTKVKFLGFEDFVQLEKDSAEAFYVVAVFDKDFYYQAHFRTKRDKTVRLNYKGQNTNLLYIADEAISSELFYDILPYFWKAIDVRKQSNYFIHIEHVAADSKQRTTAQVWTLAGDGRKIAQAKVLITQDSRGRTRFHVEKSPRIMERRHGSPQLVMERGQ